MARKRDEKPVYDYNIYRIELESVEDFKDFLEKRQFEEIPLKPELIKGSGNFRFSLMFCDKDNKTGSPWVRLLSSCTEWDLSQDLKVYGAALICQNQTACFIVSYGNAHFYISGYCDYNFGISVAERLIDLENIKAQQNVSHGSKLNKMHYDYFGGATLSYRSGEIPTYVRGKSICNEEWGDIINCGTSAQFKWDEKPLEIGEKLESLEKAINMASRITLPRLVQLDADADAERIHTLNIQLANAIKQFDPIAAQTTFINVPSFYMMGTKILQNDSIRFRLACRHKREEYDGELNLEAIKHFLSKKQFDIQDVLTEINISVEYGNDQWTPSKSLVTYIEFVTSDNFCLRGGRWCSFNRAYIERILEDANHIFFSNHTDDIFKYDPKFLLEYAKETGIENPNSNRHPYETYYNHFIATNIGAICVHPTTVAVDDQASGRYKYEICDLYKDHIMYFVKIGDPSDFAYAVDQAMLTLDRLEGNGGELILPNQETVHPTIFSLLLVFDRRSNIVTKWADVLSINFLIHLTEMKRRLNNTDIKLTIEFAYNKV